MKTKDFIKNSSYIVIGQFLVYLVDFICRIVFIHTIPQTYVGVKGLFSNILSMLSLSELGIGSVFIIYMYKPMAEHNTKRVSSLVAYFRRIYSIIIPGIFLAGCCLIPFLPHLISTATEIRGLTIIYLLYLLRTVFSFYNGHLCALFSADQKVHYLCLISYSFQIGASILEIIFLLLTGNIYIYLIIQLAGMVLQQLFFGYLAKKQYPYVCAKDAPALSKKDKHEIFGNVGAMFQHRIGATILSSTDNIIISKFINITVVAINDVYTSILAVITQIFTQIFNMLASIVGNANATSSREESRENFFHLHFINFWFYTFCSCGLLLLLEPTISILFGTDYVFSPKIAFLLVLNFYIVGIRQITLLFKESMGLLRPDRFVPLIEAFINLVISLIGVHYFGTIGVFVGTTISMVLTSLPVEPYVLFHYGFHSTVSAFWKTSIPYYVISILLLLFCHRICDICVFSNIWLTWIVRLVIALIVPNLVILLLYHRSPEMKSALQTIQQLLSNRHYSKDAK